jgi:hypothetical protein
MVACVSCKRSRMVSLLQARTILAYEPQQRSAQRTYARNLRRALDNLAVNGE